MKLYFHYLKKYWFIGIGIFNTFWISKVLKYWRINTFFGSIEYLYWNTLKMYWSKVWLTLIFHNKQSWNAKVTSEEKELTYMVQKMYYHCYHLYVWFFSEQKIKIYEENGNWWKKIWKKNLCLEKYLQFAFFIYEKCRFLQTQKTHSMAMETP